jgi:hypothetical protein
VQGPTDEEWIDAANREEIEYEEDEMELDGIMMQELSSGPKSNKR